MPWLVLDRDGVINHDSDDYIKSASEWQPIDGSIEAIATLSKHDYKIIIATNQSGLGRGLFTQADLDAMHRKMHDLVEAQGGTIEGVFYCPHTPDKNCDCRKPKVGLLEQAEQKFEVSLAGSYFVGDSLKDLQAAKRKSCIPVLVETGKGTITKTKISSMPEFNDTAVYSDLMSFTHSLLKQGAV